MNNNFVINITKSDRLKVPAQRTSRINSEELPEIEIYRTEDGKYIFSDVNTLIRAIALGIETKSDSIEIAVKVLPISERTRRKN